MGAPSRERTAHSGRIGAMPSVAMSAPVNTPPRRAWPWRPRCRSRDAGMGVGRAHQHAGERAGKLDVGDEAPAPEQEAAILDAAQRRADALVVAHASAFAPYPTCRGRDAPSSPVISRSSLSIRDQEYHLLIGSLPCRYPLDQHHRRTTCSCHVSSAGSPLCVRVQERAVAGGPTAPASVTRACRAAIGAHAHDSGRRSHVGVQPRRHSISRTARRSSSRSRVMVRRTTDRGGATCWPESNSIMKKGVVAWGGSRDHEAQHHQILTTHVGSLRRSADMIDLMRAVGRGEPFNVAAATIWSSRGVRRGLTADRDGSGIVSDGETGKPGFINYANDRLGGFERAPANTKSMWAGTAQTNAFPESTNPRSRILTTASHAVVAAITYRGHALIQEASAAQIGAGGQALRSIFVPSCRRRCWPTTSATCSTRPTRNTSSPSPKRCARNTSPSSTPGHRADRRPGTAPDHMRNPDLTMEECASGPTCRSPRSTTRCAAYRRRKSGTTPATASIWARGSMRWSSRTTSRSCEDQRRRLFVRGGQSAS